MKKQYLKFFTTVFLSLMLLTTSIVFAEDTPTTTGDELIAQDAYLEESIEALNVLGILRGYDDGSFKPNSNITRAEFSAVITRALGLEEIVEANKGVTPFTDVATDHWATGNINIAYNMGIIAGYGNDMFGPEDPVTYEQTVKMIMSALGYQELSEQMGSYPDGYLATAAQSGVSKGIQGIKGEPANRGLVAKLMFNSLTVNIMERSGYGEGATYRVAAGKNLLNQNLNIEEGVGQLTANDDMSLLGGAKMRRDEVEIDTKIYDVGETNAKDLLGYRVKYFAEIDPTTGKATLIHIREDSDSTSLVIKASDIDSYSNRMLEYWEDREKDYAPQVITIGSEAKIIVNGSPAADFNRPDSGQILLVDSDNTGEYDVVFVTSYETYVVDRINTSTHVVTAKYGKGTIDLNPKSAQFRVVVEKDGQEIETKDIRQDDVLSIAESEGNGQEPIKTVKVARNKVTGSVREISGDGLHSGDRIRINDNEYELLEDMSSEYSEISIGDRIELYLNVEGRVAGINRTSSTSQNYAYLIGVDAKGGMEGSVQFMVYTDRGALKTLRGADRIYFDDAADLKDRYDSTVVANFLTDTGGNTLRQLINYETDGGGNISRIVLARQTPAEQYFSKDFGPEEAKYSSSGKTFDADGTQYRIGSNTKIISIPLDEEDTSKYKGSYGFKNGSKYSIEIYDADKVRNISVLIVRETEDSVGSIVPNDAFAVVDTVSETNDDDSGERVHRLRGFKGGSEFDKLAIDNEILANLKKGDIIQYSTDGSGKIDNIQVLFSIAGTETNTINNGADIFAGEVIELHPDGSTTTISVDTNDGNKSFDITSSTNIYVYEEVSGNYAVRTGEQEDVFQEDLVFIRMVDDHKVRIADILIVK